MLCVIYSALSTQNFPNRNQNPTKLYPKQTLVVSSYTHADMENTDRQTQPTAAAPKLSKGLQTRESSLACWLFIKEESTVNPSVNEASKSKGELRELSRETWVAMFEHRGRTRDRNWGDSGKWRTNLLSSDGAKWKAA